MPPLGALHLGALQPSSYATPWCPASWCPATVICNAWDVPTVIFLGSSWDDYAELDRRYPMSIVPKKLRPPPPINVRLGQGLLTAGSVKGAAP